LKQCGRHIDRKPKIVGGVKAARFEFPWMVSFKTKFGHFCSGFLVTETHLISAAHCFFNNPYLEYTNDRYKYRCNQLIVALPLTFNSTNHPYTFLIKQIYWLDESKCYDRGVLTKEPQRSYRNCHVLEANSSSSQIWFKGKAKWHCHNTDKGEYSTSTWSSSSLPSQWGP